MGRFHPSVLAGALWATTAAWLVRRRLKRSGLNASVPAPFHLGSRADAGSPGRCNGSSRPASKERSCSRPGSPTMASRVTSSSVCLWGDAERAGARVGRRHRCRLPHQVPGAPPPRTAGAQAGLAVGGPAITMRGNASIEPVKTGAR